MKKKFLFILISIVISISFFEKVSAGTLYLPGKKITYEGKYSYGNVLTCLYNASPRYENIGIVFESDKEGNVSVSMRPVEYNYMSYSRGSVINIIKDIKTNADLEKYCGEIWQINTDNYDMDKVLQIVSSDVSTICKLRYEQHLEEGEDEVYGTDYQNESNKISLTKGFNLDDLINLFTEFKPTSVAIAGTTDLVERGEREEWSWNINKDSSSKISFYTVGLEKDNLCPNYLVYEYDKSSNEYHLYLTDSTNYNQSSTNDRYYFKNNGADATSTYGTTKISNTKYTDTERELRNLKYTIETTDNNYDGSNEIEEEKKKLEDKSCYYTYMDEKTGVNGCVELNFSTLKNTDTQYNRLTGIDYNSLLKFNDGYVENGFAGEKIYNYLSNGNCLSRLYFEVDGMGKAQIANNYTVLKSIYSNSNYGTFINTETFEKCNALNGTKNCIPFKLKKDELELQKINYYACKDLSCRVDALTRINAIKNQMTDLCRNYISKKDYDNICLQDCLYNLQDALDIFDTNSGDANKTTSFIKNVIKWCRYLIPVLIIILSILDFMKSIGGKEDELKKAQGKFIKRLIVAALIFLIPLIIQFVLEKFGFNFDGWDIF